MKLMTYNIWDGGINEGGDRHAVIAEVVKQVNPDMVFMQEAENFVNDNEHILKEMAQKISRDTYDVAVGTGLGETGLCAVACFGKEKFDVLQKGHEKIPYGVLVTKIKDVIVCGVHLTAKLERERYEEVQALLKILQNYDKVIVMGDFNAISPEDAFSQEELDSFSEKLKEKHFVEGHLQTKTIQAMLDAGFVDCGVLKNNRETTGPSKARDWGDDACSLRVDYVFVSENLKKYVKGFDVVKNELTDKASDHYPVVVEVEM